MAESSFSAPADIVGALNITEYLHRDGSWTLVATARGRLFTARAASHAEAHERIVREMSK